MKPSPPPPPPPPRFDGGESSSRLWWTIIRFALCVLGVFMLGFGVGRSVVQPRTIVVVPPSCELEFEADDAEAATWEVH